MKIRNRVLAIVWLLAINTFGAVDATISIQTISSVIQGNTLTVKCDIRNDGSSIHSFGVGAEIKDDSTVKADLGQKTASSVGVGDIKTVTFTYTIPTGWTAKSYTLHAVVWSGTPGSSTWLDDANRTFTVVARTIDATITIDSISSVIQGNELSVTCDVKNDGNYNRTFGVGAEIKDGSTIKASLGAKTTATVSPESSKSVTFTYNIPTGWTTKSYTFHAVVWSGTPGASTWLDDDNETFSVIAINIDATITVQKIDAVIQGETLTVKCDVQNDGNVAHSFGVGAEIKDGSAIKADLGTKTASDVDVDDTETVTFTYTIPTGWPAKSYTLHAVVWSGTPGSSTWLDEDNEMFTVVARIVNATITIDSISSVIQGSELRVTCNVKNDGNYSRTFGVGAEIKDGATVKDDLGTKTTATVSPESSKSVTFTRDITLSAQAYTLHAAVWEGTPGGNGSTWLDSADKNFSVEPQTSVTMIGASFSEGKYNKGDTVYASFTFSNDSSVLYEDAYIDIEFIDPSGLFVGGITSQRFTIGANGNGTLPEFGLWSTGSELSSGAYLPVVTLRNSNGYEVATYGALDESSALPVLAIGTFPALNNLILRSQKHFDPADSSSVESVLQEINNAGVSHISMSVKLDDGEGQWGSVSAIPGQILYSSSNVTPSGVNPLSYDLLHQAQAVASNLGMRIDPWAPAFFDKASWIDNSAWRLSVLPGQEQEYFVDPSLSAVRSYELSLVVDALQSPYSAPYRVTIDHFRYTSAFLQGSSSHITSYVQSFKTAMPEETLLAGYIWLPDDKIWSGQNWSSLYPYFDIMSPMLYWQDGKIDEAQNVAEGARLWVLDSLHDIIDEIGTSNMRNKVAPTVSVTSTGSYNDDSNFALNDREWQRTQLNVLGVLGDHGLQGYDIFYYGNWLWPVDKQKPSLGLWIDRVSFLANLGPNREHPEVIAYAGTAESPTTQGEMATVFSYLVNAEGALVRVQVTNGHTKKTYHFGPFKDTDKISVEISSDGWYEVVIQQYDAESADWVDLSSTWRCVE